MPVRLKQSIVNVLDERVDADKALNLIGLLVVLHEPAGHEADVLAGSGPQPTKANLYATQGYYYQSTIQMFFHV
jgi:hypothetical protein